MSKKISESRKTTYYIGIILILIVLLLFLSTFVTFIMNFGDFSNFNSDAKSMMGRAIGGMILMIIGIMISNMGARGLAGSGVILDPEKAREELEPYSRMAGGMVKDALDEANIRMGGKQENTIFVKCRMCKTLNEESAKFCKECGKEI